MQYPPSAPDFMNICKNCEKETCNRMYCNNTCQQAYQVKIKNLKHTLAQDYGKICQPALRRLVIKRLGKQCQICNNVKWQNQEIPLVVDHIDGNWQNNKFDNLRVICCNCDALLPTYKGRNKGKGRQYRVEAYKQNKLPT